MNITKNKKDMILGDKIPLDNTIKGLEFLFSSGFVENALNAYLKDSSYTVRAFEISYVRLKPATSCIVAYKVSILDSLTKLNTTNYFYAKAYSTENYNLAKEKALGLHFDIEDYSSMAQCYDNQQLIFYPFYADTEIQALDSLLDARKLRRIIYSHDSLFKNKNIRMSHKKMKYEIIRYKPEKRVLLKVSTACTDVSNDSKENICYYMKCDTAGRGKDVSDILLSLHKSIPNVAVPICFDSQKQFMIFKEIDANEMSMVVESDEFNKLNMMAASLIAQVHSTSVEVESVKADSFLSHDYKSTVDSIVALLPKSKSLLDEIEIELEKYSINTKSVKDVFVHGDFSYEQILFDEKKLYLLDFDRFRYGEYLIDIGNYIAHLMYKELNDSSFDSKQYITAFIDAYVEKSGYEIDQDKLNYWIAVSLINLSVKPFRLFEKNWNDKILKILKVVLDVIKN